MPVLHPVTLQSSDQTFLPFLHVMREVQSDAFTAARVGSYLHLSALDTKFQTRYNPANLFMGTKTISGQGDTTDRRNCMDAFIGILQVIRDVGVAKVHATSASYHHSQVRRRLFCTVDLDFTVQLFLGQLIK
jgi:hypothetical protein